MRVRSLLSGRRGSQARGSLGGRCGAVSRKRRLQVPPVGDHADAAALLYAVLEVQTRGRFVVRGVRPRIDVACDKARLLYCPPREGRKGPPHTRLHREEESDGGHREAGGPVPTVGCRVGRRHRRLLQIRPCAPDFCAVRGGGAADASAQTGPVDVAWGAVLRKPIGARARRRGGERHCLNCRLLLRHAFGYSCTFFWVL